MARWNVEQRDKGVCASCGFDALLTARVAAHLRDGVYRSGERYRDAMNVFGIVHRAWGVYGSAHHTPHLWEMDHITAVVEGGGGCDLENYRTLCVVCHRKTTKELAARRARQRREAKLVLFSATD